jgi:hypothetical protein
MPTREQLQRLVLTLPEEALAPAHAALTELQTWPPPIPAELERVQQQAQAWMEEMRGQAAGGGGIGAGGGGGFWGMSSPGKVRGRHSFESGDSDESVTVSHIVHDGCEFTLVERIRLVDSGRAQFVIELTGPDGTTARHEHHYPVR